MKINILEVDSIQKEINGKLILSDIYIKCKTGDIIGIFGRNGSGKSTLFKIIFGIESAENKFVKINQIVKNKTSDLLNDISYLPQDYFIPKRFSVRKAISLSINKNQIDLFIEDVNIKMIIDKYVYQLSGGELRYLEIKLILSNKSKFALLDEPFKGLSPLSIEKVCVLLLEDSKGKGILITDHNYEEMLKISNKIILLKDGRTSLIKNLAELEEKGYLKK